MRTSEFGPPAKVDTDLRPRAREIYFMENFPWRETGLARRTVREPLTQRYAASVRRIMWVFPQDNTPARRLVRRKVPLGAGAKGSAYENGQAMPGR
jgi:hypothetical protein